MSSLALYRRYRPESFAEVIGQEHVTDPLQQALRNNRVNHAYLFSGPRGCGKTTSARILARCLNCEQGPTPTPCGTCQSCRDLARNGPGSIDVIEIDAASHGGVDDARDLREKAFFGPASSRYKIYIIDEAHMVTSAGFNALLKVVEEPPEHLKFIFATTEPEKVIGTIRSRTHHYPFRLVPPGTLREYLGEVCQKEGIAVEEGVLPLVVRAGAGSVRDSMSVMDQLLAGAGEEGVTYAMATSLLGYTDGSLLDSVVEAFATGDGAAAFEVVDRVIEGGNDPRRFVADLLERLRDLVILAAVPDAADKGLIDAPADVLERMQAQAGTFGPAELGRAADIVNAGLTEMRGATSPRLQLELICARVLLPAAYGDERSLMARLDRIERGVQFSAGGAAAGVPAMGYVPGPEAHQGAAAPAPNHVVEPGGGPAAARAAVRAQAA
ncbi:DNA polymerase III subunit gamma and tau, partial [Streptomyces thermocarboxydus]